MCSAASLSIDSTVLRSWCDDRRSQAPDLCLKTTSGARRGRLSSMRAVTPELNSGA
jgi:hypothetical protein